MRRRSLLRALLLAASVARPAAAQGTLPAAEQYHLRLEYLWWSPQPSGQLQKGTADLDGTLLDVRDTLGIGQARMNPLRASLRLGESWKLRGSWSKFDFHGDAVATDELLYGATTVAPGEQVLTSLKGHAITGDVEWDALKRPSGHLGFLAGVRYFDVETVVTNVDTASREAQTLKLPAPVAGVTGRLYVGRRLSLEAEVSGMTFGGRGHVLEVFAAARVHVSDRLAGTAGYRVLGLERQDGLDFLKLDLRRWTFGAEISL
jgi:hypothetical protein